MAPSISVREFIRWLPDPAKEPTTTVVLTSGENRFVDIRILKPTDGSQHDGASSDVLPASRLSWAFAGESSSSEMVEDPRGNGIVHSTWHHWVDSSTVDAETVVDEGDMFPQKDGITLEVGSMVDPDTGRLTEYEECWKNVEPTTTGADEEGKRKCVVLLLQDDAHAARGMVIRLGQFCQGVLRVGEHFSSERWQWKQDGGWKREARIGDLWLPCGPILEGERLKLGGELKHGDYLWTAVEMSEF